MYIKKLSILFLILSNYVLSQSLQSKLDDKFSKLHLIANLPGFSVSIVNIDSVVYTNSFGFSDLETKTPFTINTKQNIASISKTLIGLSLMKLVEQGKLNMKTNINDILPFKVINPKYSKVQITIEQLATHTSSINDYEIEFKSIFLRNRLKVSKKDVSKEAYNYFFEWNKNKNNVSLSNFLKESLIIDGKNYSRKRFLKSKPGTEYKYSNLGAALAALIIELVSGEKYRDYLKKVFFDKLNFNSPLWKNEITDSDNVAEYYFQNKLNVPNYQSILFPSGGMMLSNKELSVYLIEMIKGYNGKSELVKKSLFKQMMSSKLQAPRVLNSNKNQGYFWELDDTKIGHNGANYGTICFMQFDSKTNIGKIFMTNISSYQDGKLIPKIVKIWKTLDEYNK